MRIEDWFLGFFEADGCFTHGISAKSVPGLYIGQQDDAGYIPSGVRLASVLLGGTINKVAVNG